VGSMQRRVSIVGVVLIPLILVLAQQNTAGVLSVEDLKKVVPASYFFRGQSATVQLRNSAGFRTANGRLVLASLVDTSGYSTDVAEKYQGLLITEEKLSIAGSNLVPGQYGFGFLKDDKFVVMDVGANDVLKVSYQLDANLPRAVPLKIVADHGSYRLYAGKTWVSIKLE